MTIEINYAFLDKNNKVINTAVVVKNDYAILDLLKQEYNAFQAIEYDLSIPCYFGETEWTGKHWKNPFHFASWIWNDDLGEYEPPVPMPEDELHYVWSETEMNWIAIEDITPITE